jgi:phenylacetate-CoA ligase
MRISAQRAALLAVAQRWKGVRLLSNAVRYNPLYYDRARKAIRAFAMADITQRRVLRQQLCSQIIEFARQTKYGGAQGADFKRWPILDKATVRDHPRDFVRGILPAIPASTGGTTGLPLRLYRSFECVAAEQAFIDHLLIPHHWTFRDAKVATLRADQVKDPSDTGPPYGVLASGGSRLTLSNPHLSRGTVAWFAESISSFEPQILWAYPSMLLNLVHLMNEQRLRIHVPVVLTSSETLGIQGRNSIVEALSCELIDYYGQAERACFAASVQPDVYYFQPAYGNVELHETKGVSEVSGAKLAKIVATGYWNSRMPLVRYDTGDYALVPGDASAENLELIELGIKPFSGIAGRKDEYIILRDGRQIGGLNHLPREVEHILSLQVIQDAPEAIRIHVLTTADFNIHDEQKIMSNARRLIPFDVQIGIFAVGKLERVANGKTPLVIRRI